MRLFRYMVIITGLILVGFSIYRYVLGNESFATILGSISSIVTIITAVLEYKDTKKSRLMTVNQSARDNSYNIYSERNVTINDLRGKNDR